jgi:ankyrin repeat protein
MKQTALHVAASEAYFDMVKLLLTYGKYDQCKTSFSAYTMVKN